MGARSKLTPDVQARILEGARNGATFAACAAYAGIAASTLHAWRARGAEAKSGLYRDFVNALARAEAEGEAVAAAQLVAGFTQPNVETRRTIKGDTEEEVIIQRPPDARLALAWLERRRPETWSPKHRVAVRFGSVAEALGALNVEDLSPAELALVERIVGMMETDDA